MEASTPNWTAHETSHGHYQVKDANGHVIADRLSRAHARQFTGMPQAMEACALLHAAYEQAAEPGGAMPTETVDDAERHAHAALLATRREPVLHTGDRLRFSEAIERRRQEQTAHTR